MTWTEKDIQISEIENLLNAGYEVEVDSPDGFVPVSMFVDKGDWEEYTLTTDNGNFVRVNENHLFETTSGWKYAKDLVNLTDDFITRSGPSKGNVIKTGYVIPIVDIQVEHDNHRYYTNGVSSHNTGVGKSLFMCHCAAANLAAGKNVLYITMEMSEEKIAERIDTNLMNVSMSDLAEMPRETYFSRMKKLKDKIVGKLIIKEYPTSSAGSGNFRHLLNELKLKKNFVPDVIYIDYLNICNSSRIKSGSNVNSYTYIKAIAEELRGLAVEFNVPIVSATQTTRGGYGNSDVEITDTSESFGLPATTDLMIALISSEELDKLNQIMVKQLKNRYNDLNYFKRFVIGVDRSKMKLFDVEESAQKNLVDDTPVMDNTTAGKRMSFDKSKFKEFT